MNDIVELEARIADLNSRRMNWKWAPDAPLQPIEQEILRVLEQVINLYADSSPTQREYIRKMMPQYGWVGQYLKVFVTGDMTKLDSVVSPDRLYQALIAVSLDNHNFGDYRDVLTMLGNLWLTAAQAGIDPLPLFLAVANMSGTQVHEQGNVSTQQILAHYHDSAHFKVEVEPRLSQRS